VVTAFVPVTQETTYLELLPTIITMVRYDVEARSVWILMVETDQATVVKPSDVLRIFNERTPKLTTEAKWYRVEESQAPNLISV